jgi:hypothetical protein
MNLAARPWIVAITLGLLALSPLTAQTGMNPEEVKEYKDSKAKGEKGDVDAQMKLGFLYATSRNHSRH